MNAKAKTVEKQRDRSIFVDPELHHEIRMHAAKEGESIKQVVEKFIHDGLEKSQAA